MEHAYSERQGIKELYGAESIKDHWYWYVAPGVVLAVLPALLVLSEWPQAAVIYSLPAPG